MDFFYILVVYEWMGNISVTAALPRQVQLSLRLCPIIYKAPWDPNKMAVLLAWARLTSEGGKYAQKSFAPFGFGIVAGTGRHGIFTPSSLLRCAPASVGRRRYLRQSLACAAAEPAQPMSTKQLVVAFDQGLG
jgi:hypothetical protein